MSISGSIATWCLWGTITLLVVSNVVFLRSTHRLTDAIADYRGRFELQVGDRVPTLTGTDKAGQPLNLAYDSEQRKTLLLVFSAECSFCSKNWPNWQRLIAQAGPEQIRVVGVDLAGTADAAYLNANGLGALPVFGALEYLSASGYKFRAVPTTMLISQTGRVEQLWRGLLDAGTLQSAEAALRSHDSTVGARLP